MTANEVSAADDDRQLFAVWHLPIASISGRPELLYLHIEHMLRNAYILLPAGRSWIRSLRFAEASVVAIWSGLSLWWQGCRPSFFSFAVVLFCLLGSRALAFEDPDFNGTLWQMEEGLPNNVVQAITQTHDGYLWVGTREGLVRFDGIDFQIRKLAKEGAEPSVLSLLEGRDGTLWIGTAQAGLMRWADGRLEHLRLPSGDLEYPVSEIHEAADGAIWIVSNGWALGWRNGKFESTRKLHRVFQGLCVDLQGKVWTAGGALTRIDVPYPTNAIPGGAPGFIGRVVYCDSEGTFWFGDGETLVRYKDGQVTRLGRPSGAAGYVSVIFRSRAGDLWVGTYLGLRRFVDGKFISLGKPDAPEYRVYCVYEDREENLWVGSEEGLLRLTPKTFRTLTKTTGLAGNTVASVCAGRDGSVWISPWGFGLNRWINGRIESLTQNSGLSSDFIMAMAEGRDGGLWAGADNGGELNCIHGDKVTTFGQDQGFIMSRTTATTAMYEDPQGILWIGSRELLQCWDGQRFTRFTVADGLSHPKINAIIGGAAGVVWIGTDGGLTRWRLGRFENLAATNALLRVPILSLYEDANRCLWIGSKGHGLLCWQDGIVREFTTAQGLFSDAIYAILEDAHSNLWLNGSRGIFRVDKQELRAVTEGLQDRVTSISYGKADGILSSGQYQDVTQPTACKSTDGRLWFRTTQGVAVVDPAKLSINRLAPPVVIEEVVADRRAMDLPWDTGDGRLRVVVPPGRGELEIHYAALSFRAPEKNRFRYQLEGVDLGWVDAGSRRTALYNDVTPGSHRFRVVACNNDGIWSQETVADLTLRPHFWQTWWFRSLSVAGSVALLIGVVFLIARQRMRRRLARLEQQNAIEEERTRIARDMHDELGAKLTRISFQGDTARRQLAAFPDADQHIAKMSATARELISSLDQIVWAVDPENDSLESLANYICRYASEFFEDSPVRCEFVIPEELPPGRLQTKVRHNVFLAVKEILNNALKHSGAEKVVLSIMMRRDAVEITVADDGHGFRPSDSAPGDRTKRTGSGLGNLRERLRSINGEFELRDRPGGGTEARIVVPLTLDTIERAPDDKKSPRPGF